EPSYPAHHAQSAFVSRANTVSFELEPLHSEDATCTARFGVTATTPVRADSDAIASSRTCALTPLTIGKRISTVPPDARTASAALRTSVPITMTLRIGAT